VIIIHILYLINNDMKDSSKTFNLTLAAILFPVFMLGIILTGIFVVDQSVLAQESSPINSETHESYFQADENATLAQSGGLLQPRSESDEATSTSEDSVDAAECSNVYIEDDLRIDFDNDEESVLKLQSFLKTYEGYDYVELTGTFGEDTLRAVQSFQTRYAEDILEPWGYQPDEATGYVYITTKQKINEIHCDQQFDLTQTQQEEIREFRELLNELRSVGYSFKTPNYLASYYADMNASVPEFDTEDPEPVTEDQAEDDVDDYQDVQGTSTASTSVEGSSDDRNFFQRLFGIGGSSQSTESATTSATTTDEEGIESDEATTTSTSTEETADDRNFFQRLFGIGNDADDESATTTATSTETEEEPVEEEVATSTATSTATGTTATSVATTSSLGDVASGVYNGVNSILNFLLSPTFLLIVLVILILLLVATIIESSDDKDEDDEMDPWAEYDETQDIDDDQDDDVSETDDADESDESEKGDDIPTPPEDKEDTSDSGKKKNKNN